MKTGTIVAFLLIALLGGLPASAQDATVRIAIANPARIFSEIKQTQEIERQLREHQAQVQQKDQEMKTNIKTLREAREQVKRGTPEYEQRNAELLKALIEHESWAQLTKLEVQQKNKAQTLALFEKIRESVAEVARQKGIDLVIADQRVDLEQNFDKLTVDQLRSALTEQNILFSNDKADISDEVIALMDAQYQSNPQQ